MSTENTQSPNTPQPAPEAHKKKSRSGCISRLAKIILILFVVWWFNNCTIKITKEEITSDKVKNEIKIAVLSDQHASDKPFTISNERIIDKVNKINPDVVCVLGDMHSSNASENDKQISMNLMKDIVNSGYKLYFVLGEHDDRHNSYVSKMEKNGIDVLDQESETIKIKDSEVTFYGISNAYFSPTFDLNNEFDIDRKKFNVLLAHIPMYSDYEKFGADLTLCGDTHGGVIQVPFLGPAYYNGKILPELFDGSENVYDKGLFKYSGGYIFITSGIGNYPVPARFNNRPEIGEIIIKPE